MRRFIRKSFILSVTFIITLAFFPSKFYGQNVALAQTVSTVSLVGKYDSSDLAIIKSVDSDNKTITFRNHDTGRDYTLSYDNTTLIYSEYGRALSAKLLEVGEIAKITFLSGSRHLNSLDISSEAFSVERSYGYDLRAGNETAQIGNSYYHITDKTLVLIDGKPGRIADVLQGDSIKVSGIGTEIYCVEVKQGHGYVSLSSSMIGNDSIEGAYLEIGDRNIYRVTDGMLVSIPEGTYKLYLTGKGVDYETTITVDRDKETVVDTSQIEIEYNYGLVTFRVTPAEARLYIDGEEVNPAWPIELTYGTHRIEATAQGYISCSEYLHVGSSKAEVEITLPVDESYQDEEEDSTTASSVDNSSSSKASTTSSSSKDTDKSDNSSTAKSKSKTTKTSSSATTATTVKDGTLITGYYIRIIAPSNVEVYLDPDKNKKGDDGTYIGIAPCAFTKITGEHVIRLKRDGYLTKDYTISIDSEKKDKEYAFDELKIDPASSSASTASTEVADGTKIDGYGIYVDAPIGSTLYVDGEEIGSVPCSFDKVKGSHTITLTRDGYVTKSYSVYVDGNKKDKVYEFPALERYVYIYALDGTEVYLNDDLIGTAEDGDAVTFQRVPDDYYSGTSTIKLELEGYNTIEEEVSIGSGDGIDYHYYADRQTKQSSDDDDSGKDKSSDSASSASTESSSDTASTGESTSGESDSTDTGNTSSGTDNTENGDDNSGGSTDDSTSASSGTGGTTESNGDETTGDASGGTDDGQSSDNTQQTNDTDTQQTENTDTQTDNNSEDTGGSEDAQNADNN